jgi:precorrin-2 methylase
MTILAVRVLARADVIAVADSGSGESAVLRIAGPLVSGKPILKLDMPMTPARTGAQPTTGPRKRL